MSQLKKGALLSYVNIFLTITIGLVLTPFIIRSLGNSEYGLYTLIGSFVAYLALMDFGLNNTIIRFVAKYRAEKDLKGEQQFLGSIFIIYFIISFVLVLIGIFLYFRLETIFGKSLNPEEIRKAKIMFQFLIFDLAIALPGGAFTAICNAYECFVMPRIISIVKYLFRGLTVFAVLTMGGKAISIVIIDTILNVITIMVIAFFVFNHLKVKINFKGVEKALVKIIFSYSVWIFVIGIIQTFQWNIGQMILGMTTNTIQVAVFSVGIMLGTYYGTFASAINGVILPRATQMTVSNHSGMELTKTMIQIGRINIMIQYFILSGFILFGRIFIKLWVGDSYVNSWIIALLIMLVLTVPLSQSFGNSLLEAKNKVRFKAILTLITLSIGVIIGFYASKVYGFYGILFPLVIAIFINSIITNIYFVTVFDFQYKMFFTAVFLKQTLVILLVTGISYFILSLLQIDTWLLFLGTGMVFLIVYVVSYYLFLLDKNEKGLLKKYI